MSVTDYFSRSVRDWQLRANEITHHVGEMTTVLGGLYEYRKRGAVSSDTRRALLNLHCRTNGQFTDRLATLVRTMRLSRSPAPVTGFLGNLSVEKQKSIAVSIVRDGFYVFENRVPADLCDDAVAFASRTPCIVEGRDPSDRVLFDASTPISKTYRAVEDEIITNRAMQRLMADPTFLAIAEIYLRTHPILSRMGLWWSATYGDQPGGEAAQEFHFDFDPPPIWLLIFVYLTDVGPENGPHVFVRGSHKAGHPAAAPLRARGYVRIPDEDIEAAFGRENVVELCGKRGTVLAVDTRGFHKGKMLTSGHRLITQLTFSCPPYSGAHGPSKAFPEDIDPALAAAIARTPRVYQRYR
jgi:hypothetical protein